MKGTFDHMVNLTFGLKSSTSPEMDLNFRVPLIQTTACLLLSSCIPQIASRTRDQHVILSIFIGLATQGTSCLNLKCSNCHVETNYQFSPHLILSFLSFFSFFCIGSHGNKSVGRESVTLLLAFCTIQNPSSDPQASVIQKGSKSTVP